MTSFVPPLTRMALVLCCLVALVAGTVAAPAQTISDINKANGFHEMLMGIGPGFTAAVKSAPGMPPQKVQDALAAAMEGAFDPNKMETAIEARMDGKLSAKDLSDLAAFYASPSANRSPRWRSRLPRRKRERPGRSRAPRSSASFHPGIRPGSHCTGR